MADYKQPNPVKGVARNPLDVLKECERVISDKRPWYSAVKSAVFGDKFDKYEADIKQLKYFIEAGGEDDKLAKDRQSNPKVLAICEKLLSAINSETSIDVSSMLRDISGAPAKVKEEIKDNIVIPLIDVAEVTLEKAKETVTGRLGTIAIAAGIGIAVLIASKVSK